MFEFLRNIFKKKINSSIKSPLNKVVYQLDTDGFYVNETLADESPREPGVFHIPLGCVEVPPPVEIEGKRIRFVEGSWKYEDFVIESIPEIISKEEILRRNEVFKELERLTFVVQPDIVRDIHLKRPGALEKLEELDKHISELRTRVNL